MATLPLLLLPPFSRILLCISLSRRGRTPRPQPPRSQVQLLGGDPLQQPGVKPDFISSFWSPVYARPSAFYNPLRSPAQLFPRLWRPSLDRRVLGKSVGRKVVFRPLGSVGKKIHKRTADDYLSFDPPPSPRRIRWKSFETFRQRIFESAILEEKIFSGTQYRVKVYIKFYNKSKYEKVWHMHKNKVYQYQIGRKVSKI